MISHLLVVTLVAGVICGLTAGLERTETSKIGVDAATETMNTAGIHYKKTFKVSLFALQTRDPCLLGGNRGGHTCSSA